MSHSLVRPCRIRGRLLGAALSTAAVLSACSPGTDTSAVAASTAPTSSAPASTTPSTTSSSTTTTSTTTTVPVPVTTARTTPTTAAPATAAPTTVSRTISVPTGWRNQLISLINDERAKAGVGPVALCASLNTAAQDFSSVLAAWGTMSHVGPDGSTLYTRVAAAGYVGYTSVSENVAAGQLDAATVMGSWMASSGHRANILYPTFTQVGAGRSDALVDGVTVPYWVLDLGVGGSC